jgi:sugar lactone lactonase YvrE
VTWTQSASLRVDCRCTLGEGIIWWPARDALLWTDIEASRLWMQQHGRKARSWALPDRLGSMAVCASGRLLLGLAKGLSLVELDEGRDRLEATSLVAVEPELRTRVNDGRVDRAGNFVFGTMDLEKTRGIGSFYQYSARYGLRRLDLEPVAISNSICFSPDGRTMYFCDSPRRRIMQCEYDAETARVSHVRVFVDVPADGSPDGSIVDAEGCLWNAEWGSSTVRRYRRNPRRRGQGTGKKPELCRARRAGSRRAVRDDGSGEYDRGRTGGNAACGRHICGARRVPRPDRHGRRRSVVESGLNQSPRRTANPFRQ